MKKSKDKPEKKPKPTESMAKIGKRTAEIHDVLHGRKVKKQ